MADAYARKIYAARLSPHRSMSPRSFMIFIIAFLGLQLIYAVPFFIIGAWPVVGFMGLDALALYIAFRLNYRSARVFETLDLTMLELVFTKINVLGQQQEWRFNPFWVRLEQQNHEEFGMQSIALACKGERIEIGSFLGPDQKADLARELRNALAVAREGVKFN